MNVKFFCFDAKECSRRAGAISALGNEVDANLPDGPDFLKKLKANPPDVFVIDLSRVPSQGRDIGVYFRHAKATRHVPLLFVGGEIEKVERVKQVLPDAAFSSWDDIERALVKVCESPIVDPVVPESVMAGYSGTPLLKKLNVKEGMALGLINAPENAMDILGDLPQRVKVFVDKESECALYLWFLRSQHELQCDIESMVSAAEFGRIWMIWPKKSSPLAGDLTQQHVRDVGLAAGLVDYKVCAVDLDWTGLLFTKRKK